MAVERFSERVFERELFSTTKRSSPRNKTGNLNIGVWFANELKSGTYKNLIMGNGNTSLSYYGYWTGGTNPVLTITYTK